eukprot:TRINITY_DN3374_c0_g1_i11.p1 TRINITY_DN3374_c0_g1~~TRINITY_DN3374_c0_g1_i11.p1  ORF type:complete len:855 (-),score=238.02 TRINITY_DN3374_c0_g1_i11:109-2673(-)
MLSSGRTTPLPLADIAGLSVLRELHRKSYALEKTYTDYISGLPAKAAELEENLNLSNIDPSEVIQKFSAKIAREEEERARKTREQQKKKLDEEVERMQNRRMTRGTKRKAMEQAAASVLGKKNSATVVGQAINKKNDENISTSQSAAIPQQHDQDLPISTATTTATTTTGPAKTSVPNFDTYSCKGIPPTEEYIRYRKCLYVENIRVIREELSAALTPNAINSLLSIIFKMDSKLHEPLERSKPQGIFTLKAFLFNQFCRSFRLSSHEYPKNMKKVSSLVVISNQASIENRIGPTILKSLLLDSFWLTKLTLENTCTDNLLECVGRVARNLEYLNICGSDVTDQGLLNLVGVENNGSLSRQHLTRKCKRAVMKQDNLIQDKNPRWNKLPNRGADKLIVIEAFDLCLRWPTKGISSSYQSTHYVPIDSGFIAMLEFMPRLKVLNTEVGGRTVQAFARYQRWNRKSATRNLNLENLTEVKPNASMLECVGARCPNLKKIRMKRQEFCRFGEDWLAGMSSLKNIQHLIGNNVDLGTHFLPSSLPSFGDRLSSLHFDDVRVFKFSVLQLIKESCPNLNKLVIIMFDGRLSPYKRIKVEKDSDLRSLLAGKQHALRQLTELHLIGPLFADYVRYAIAGADKLRSLTLGVEWPDDSYCNVGPEARKDVIGREYLDELLSVNTMDNLEEIHLFAQFRRGSYRLTEEFAVHLATIFKHLKHIGTFRYWARELHVANCIRSVLKVNPAITFDENYNVTTNRRMDKPNFNAGTFRGESPYSCAWLNLQPPSLTLFNEVAEFLVGPGAFPWDFPGNQIDEPLLDEDEDSDDSSDFGDVMHPLQVNQIDEDDDVVDHMFVNACPMQ